MNLYIARRIALDRGWERKVRMGPDAMAPKSQLSPDFRFELLRRTDLHFPVTERFMPDPVIEEIVEAVLCP